MSVAYVSGQLPPVFFICLIISFLWLRNFLHLNIKWSTVTSSSSHGHIGLSVNPSLYNYDLIFPCPVSIVVNSGNIGIFCVTLFLTDGEKAFVTAPLLVSIHCCSHICSPWSFSLVKITSFGILSYTTGPSSTAASFASLSTNSSPLSSLVLLSSRNEQSTLNVPMK